MPKEQKQEKREQGKRTYGTGSLYLVGEIYYASRMHEGRRLRVSTGKKTRREAEIELSRLIGRSVRKEIATPNKALTVANLLDEHLKAFRRKVKQGSRSQRTYDTYESQVELHLKPYFGPLLPKDVKAKQIADYRRMREEQESLQGTDRKRVVEIDARAKTDRKAGPKTDPKMVRDTSINRELSVLRKAMRDLMKEDPDTLPSLPYFKMEKENNARKGFIRTDDFIERLLPKLPFYLQAVAIGAFYFGGRKSDWTSLDCNEVDLSLGPDGLPGFIHFDETKNKVERDVPITPGLMHDAFVKQREWHDLVCPEEKAFFLEHKGTKRLGDFEKAWEKACTEAGFQGLLFHDLRRSANRNMRDKGIPQGVRMELMGQKTRSMDLRYGIVDRENITGARTKMIAEGIR